MLRVATSDADGVTDMLPVEMTITLFFFQKHMSSLLHHFASLFLSRDTVNQVKKTL